MDVRNKKGISNEQMQLFMFCYFIGAYLLFNMGNTIKQDAWIASIIAAIVTIPIAFMYGRIMNLYPGKNIYDISEIVMGKLLGKLLNIILICHSIFLGAYILNDFLDFIKLTSLFNTPSIFPTIFIGILSVWILLEGIEVLSSWTHFFIRIIVFCIAIIWILLIPEMKFANLHPIFYHGGKNILIESFKLVMYPFSEIFIFTTFFDYVDYNDKSKNIFIKPLVIGGVVSILSTIINIMVLGGEAYSIFYYSSYDCIKRLKFQGEFQRIEIMVAVAFTIIQFVELNFCILGAFKGIKNIFNLKNDKYILIGVVCIVTIFSNIMFKSIMESMEFSESIWPYYGVVIQLLIPIFILICGLIKKKINN